MLHSLTHVISGILIFLTLLHFVCLNPLRSTTSGLQKSAVAQKWKPNHLHGEIGLVKNANCLREKLFTKWKKASGFSVEVNYGSSVNKD